jgi:hypothetical protein
VLGKRKGVCRDKTWFACYAVPIKECAMSTMMVWKQVLCVLPLVVVFAAGPVLAGESEGVMERVETTAKRVSQKIEDKTKAVVRKVEEKHIVDKVGEKLKKAATKTAEGFEKAGNKIKAKLGD